MKHWHKLVLALAVLGTCVLVGSVAFAATSKRHAKAPAVKSGPAATKPHAKARPIQIRKAKKASPKAPAKKSSSRENTSDDPDNVQSGDRSGPETADTEEQSQSESESDSEQGERGEPAEGHEDPPGDASHECTGDCQE